MIPTRSLKTVAALGMLSSAVWASTYASFSDSADAATSTFTAGTLDIVAGGDADDAYSFSTLNAANMKPGEAVYAPMDLTNAGTLAASVDMTAQSLTGSGLPLLVSVRKGATACSSTFFASGTALLTDQPIASASFDDQVLPVSALATSLCFKVELPATTPDTAQGKTAGVTFRFAASVA